jgi:hypothetical protein
MAFPTQLEDIPQTLSTQRRLTPVPRERNSRSVVGLLCFSLVVSGSAVLLSQDFVVQRPLFTYEVSRVAPIELHTLQMI